MESLADEYLSQCRNNYINKITPSGPHSLKNEGYAKLVAIAQSFFNSNRTEEFSGFFQEPQYLVNLWTAHLLIEYGHPSSILKGQALVIIKRYSEGALDPRLADEEKKWIETNHPELLR
jgi:hypothetical protein